MAEQHETDATANPCCSVCNLAVPLDEDSEWPDGADPLLCWSCQQNEIDDLRAENAELREQLESQHWNSLSEAEKDEAIRKATDA